MYYLSLVKGIISLWRKRVVELYSIFNKHQKYIVSRFCYTYTYTYTTGIHIIYVVDIKVNISRNSPTEYRSGLFCLINTFSHCSIK